MLKTLPALFVHKGNILANIKSDRKWEIRRNKPNILVRGDTAYKICSSTDLNRAERRNSQSGDRWWERRCFQWAHQPVVGKLISVDSKKWGWYFTVYWSVCLNSLLPSLNNFSYIVVQTSSWQHLLFFVGYFQPVIPWRKVCINLKCAKTLNDSLLMFWLYVFQLCLLKNMFVCN